ncbi:MAG: hypothetical protein KAG04_01570 [Mycoplasmataceae bacterium]|nr:hypothetical protein [Mycoplasmataceae bacterium]
METTELSKRLKKQVVYATIQLILSFIVIITVVVIIMKTIQTGRDMNKTYSGVMDRLMSYIWIMFLVIFPVGIAKFVFWILGIVNAVRINGMTNGENTVLVIFSIITLTFVHLIIAVITKNKYNS